MKHLEKALIGKKGIPFYFLITILAIGIQAILSLLAFMLILIKYPSASNLLFEGNYSALFDIVDRNIMLLVIMLPIAISLAILILLIKFSHKRSFSEIINGTNKIRWNRTAFGFGIWFLILGIATIGQFIISPEDFHLQFSLGRFALLFIISLIFIPLQTTFEELLFRGYIAQGVATITRNRWLILLIPALTFAFMHMNNPEIEVHGASIMFFNYFAIAIIFGTICILDDGLELAIGMHAANNIFISLFTSEANAAFETYAVFEVAKSDPYWGLLALMITGLIAIAIFYKKYNWSFRTLNKKVDKPVDSPVSIS